MRKICAFMLLLLFTLGLCSCSLSYTKDASYNNLQMVYSNLEKRAYAYEYIWDNSTTDVVIPDEYEGKKIVSLGGYRGRGFPMPFRINVDNKIEIVEKMEDYEIRGVTYDYVLRTMTENTVINYYDFNLYIGKNIKSIYIDDSVTFITNNEVKTAYVPRVNVFCDEENEKFYSENGKLYYAENNELVSEFVYVE